eukprot:14605038-Alexandrium_andersonii.AAC.1
MSASLVGSEMCIRDRLRWRQLPGRHSAARPPPFALGPRGLYLSLGWGCCLLYTSDAADDM